MSNGKIKKVYAKQALLKPSKNFRYLCQKARLWSDLWHWLPLSQARRLLLPLQLLVTVPKLPD